jgi:RNA polymerase sigma factor (sigma-70 family)
LSEVPLLIDHLFRHEAGKMVSHLTKLFGLNNLNLAEDVVQDTLLRAMETWKYHDLPENPSAWLMRAARNRAIDAIRREANFRNFTPELAYLLKQQESLSAGGEPLWFEKEIQDDQLRLMFSCCLSELSREVQVTLILKSLCGFSVGEIARALLVSQDSIEKRLSRAKKVFQDQGRLVEVEESSEMEGRLEAIYDSIYLLFNEGYHGSQSELMIREELCYEALRLALLLADHPAGQKPLTYALIALMCFHAARLSSRVDEDGCLILLEIQDRKLWNRDLIAQGFHYFAKAAEGSQLSEYHLEAYLASLHCMAASYRETNWAQMVKTYDRLYRLKPSPIVALNRAIALAQVEGPQAGLEALDALEDEAQLEKYPFYPAARGEFHRLAGHDDEAQEYFRKALGLARSPAEMKFFEMKLKK